MECEEEEEEEGAAAMLWSIQEAVEKQTLQIGASACGATAVVDVLRALGLDVAPEEADRCVQTRLRRNEAPLPDYLLSRSEAGKKSPRLPPSRRQELKSLRFSDRSDARAADHGRAAGQRRQGEGQILPLPSSQEGQAGPLARTLDPQRRRPRGNHEHAGGRS